MKFVAKPKEIKEEFIMYPDYLENLQSKTII